jgi:hypothetical protein
MTPGQRIRIDREWFRPHRHAENRIVRQEEIGGRLLVSTVCLSMSNVAVEMYETAVFWRGNPFRAIPPRNCPSEDLALARHEMMCGEASAWLFEQGADVTRRVIAPASGNLLAGRTSLRELSDRFHAHLDVCQQCSRHPFELCGIGHRLLARAAGLSSAGGDPAHAEPAKDPA